MPSHPTMPPRVPPPSSSGGSQEKEDMELAAGRAEKAGRRVPGQWHFLSPGQRLSPSPSPPPPVHPPSNPSIHVLSTTSTSPLSRLPSLPLLPLGWGCPFQGRKCNGKQWCAPVLQKNGKKGKGINKRWRRDGGGERHPAKCSACTGSLMVGKKGRRRRRIPISIGNGLHCPVPTQVFVQKFAGSSRQADHHLPGRPTTTTPQMSK